MSESIVIQVDEDLEEIMPRYLEIRQTELLELEKSVKAEDFKQIRMLGHKLKGTGSAYGFEELTRLGMLIEDLAAEEQMGDIPEYTAAIRHYLENLKVEYIELD